MFLGYLRTHPRLLLITGGGLGFSYYQRTSSRSMTSDFGASIDSAFEKLGERLAFKIRTMSTGPKLQHAGTQLIGPGSSQPVMQAASKEPSMMQNWGDKIKRCARLGGRDCPRVMRMFAARISRKK